MSVANHPLPCAYCGSFKLFKISTPEFSTVGMCRQFHACPYTFLTTVTNGAVHGVYKVDIRRVEKLVVLSCVHPTAKVS